MAYFNSNLKIYCFITVVAFLAIAPAFTRAAVLSLALPQESYLSQGENVILEVRLDPAGESINAVEAKINFPPELLEVTEFNQEDSLLSLWAMPPEINQAEGYISLAGGVPNGDYGQDSDSLEQGYLIGKIVFRVTGQDIDAGLAELFFSDSQVLFNDGFGTSAKLTTEGEKVRIGDEVEELEEIVLGRSFVYADGCRLTVDRF